MLFIEFSRSVRFEVELDAMATRRRLRALGSHTCPAAAGAVEQTGGLAKMLEQGGAVGFPLARQDGTGQLTAESVAELTDLMEAAAGRLDFRAAANLHQMLTVLGVSFHKHLPSLVMSGLGSF